MIELFFTACLTFSPAACEEQSIVSLEESGGGLLSCMLTAQPQLAEWCATHPNMRIARWSCRNASEREIRA